MDYCRNCGANLAPGATVCKRCGAPVPQTPPEDDKGFFEKLGDKLEKEKEEKQQEKKEKPDKRERKGKFLVTVLVILLVLVAVVCVVALISAHNSAAKQPEAEAYTSTPVVETAVPTAEPVETEQPKAEWVDIYKSFLESEPTVNSKVLKNADVYGFDGLVTAELFALSDVNGDGVPELLLATKPDTVPGWNITGSDGYAVESYIICGIENGRVSPMVCGGVDYAMYPVAICVNDSWLLEQSYGDNAQHTMVFYSPNAQNNSTELKYEFTVENRSNSQGQGYQIPVERYYIDDTRVTMDTWLNTLLPDGEESLNYYPILFKELAPGCLDNLEDDWNNRQFQQVGRYELSKLWTAASSDVASQDGKENVEYTKGVYCISYEIADSTAVLVLGIDQGSGWGYVYDLSVESVSMEGADAWINSATDTELSEGQVYQLVVGLSMLDGAEVPSAVEIQVKLTLRDGTELTQTMSTELPTG